DHHFPIAPDSGLKVLRLGLEGLEERLGKDSPDLIEYQSILTALTHLPARTSSRPGDIAERHREKEVIKRRLATLAGACPAVRAQIDENVVAFNGRRGEPHSFDLLDELL